MKKLILIPLVLAMGGCGSSVSSTSSSESATGTGSYSIIQRTKDFFASKSKKMSIEMPLSVLIVEASKDWSISHGISLNPHVEFNENACNFSPALNKLNDLGEDHGNQTLSEIMKEFETEFESIPEAKRTDLEKKQLANVKAILSVKNDDYVCARFFVEAGAYPYSGWPKLSQTEFAAAVFEAGLVANALQTEIISELGDKSTWKSDAEIKKEVNEILDRIVRDGRYTNIVYNSTQTIVNNFSSLALNFSNQQAAPIEFSIGDYNVQGSSNGVSLIKSGTQWFGHGYVSSKKYMTSVESIQAASMAKSKTIVNKSQNSESQSEGNSAQVGN